MLADAPESLKPDIKDYMSIVQISYSSFFLIEFYRICRISMIVFLVIFIFKLPKMVFYNFYRFCGFHRI